jgi:hypothetical protein
MAFIRRQKQQHSKFKHIVYMLFNGLIKFFVAWVTIFYTFRIGRRNCSAIMHAVLPLANR